MKKNYERRLKFCYNSFFNVLMIIFIPITLLLKLFKIRFLDVKITFAIGHLAVEPDSYIKEKYLGLAKKYFMILDIPTKRIFNIYPKCIAVNSAIIEYWEKYYFVVKSPWGHLLCSPFKRSGLLNYSVFDYACNYLGPSRCPLIQKLYTKPLLKLKPKHVLDGNQILAKWGLKKDDWFVCFNSREENFRNDLEVSIRNSNINSMYLGLKEIVKRGGYCIRVGRKTSPLPPRIKKLNNIIDYSHSEFISDWMDLFLIGSSKFFFGSSISGIKEIALLFGIPTLIVNVFPFCSFPFRSIDLGIPKLYFSKKENKILKFPEIVRIHQGSEMLSKYFEDFEMIENSEEEIKEAILEMLDRLDGKFNYDKEDEILQNKFHSTFLPNNFCYGTSAQAGSAFLKKYKHLL